MGKASYRPKRNQNRNEMEKKRDIKDKMVDMPIQDEEGIEEKDVNLKDFGITETMCSYIIEYVKGNLLEIIDPSLAMVYLNRAEEYMADLKEYQTNFNQRKVRNVFRV